MTILYYIHDPMCSWCWGFKESWSKLQHNLPATIKIEYLLGGLAIDNDETMSLPMKKAIQNTWRTIQKHIPGVKFNFDFWLNNIPRRSTYPACRAVIAARNQNHQIEMIKTIQQAYYLEALNPSDMNVLCQCAKQLNLNMKSFEQDLNSTQTQAILEKEINLSRELGAQGFPSLILEHNNKDYFIEINYNDYQPMLQSIETIIH